MLQADTPFDLNISMVSDGGPVVHAETGLELNSDPIAATGVVCVIQGLALPV